MLISTFYCFSRDEYRYYVYILHIKHNFYFIFNIYDLNTGYIID